VIAEDHLEFLQTIWARRPIFTYIFLGINIAIFVLMALGGGSTNQATLLAFGVKSNPEIARGQWWRFVTPICIHIGMLHLFFNSYALWIVGPQVEKLYGPARFVILYVLTGVAGVYASYFYHPETFSAGASGAIFGLFGVLLVFGLRYRDAIPPHFKRAVGTGILPVIVINLVIGFTMRQFIDNSAHIGGLLAGGALAAVVPFHKPGTEESNIFKSVQMALLVVIAVSFYSVAKNYDGPQLSLNNFTRSFTQMVSTRSTTDEFVNAINDAQKTFEASAQDVEAARMDQLDSVKKDVAKSIDEMRKIPSIAPGADRASAALLRLLQDQYDLIQDIQHSGIITFAHSQRVRQNVQL